MKPFKSLLKMEITLLLVKAMFERIEMEQSETIEVTVEIEETEMIFQMDDDKDADEDF